MLSLGRHRADVILGGSVLELLQVSGASLEVSDWGVGEPIIFIQTALTADELLPLARESVLKDFRKIVYHRRGYAGSSPVNGQASIQRDALDCIAVLKALRAAPAHIVGYSYSGAVALVVAAQNPESVRTLTLIEPPPVHTSFADEFQAANEELFRSRQDKGSQAALDDFLMLVIGADWRSRD
jgi:pimeloyl-ACP methyl ester carboxylesterase